MRTKIELCQNRCPVCPYCGEKYEVEDRVSDGDVFEVECGSCEKHFDFSPVVQVSYSTVGSCERNGEMPHELQPGYLDVSPMHCRKCSREVYEWELPNGQYPSLKADEFVMVERQ